MVEEFATPERIELVEHACAQLCSLLDVLRVEMDGSDDPQHVRRLLQRGLELARAAVAALDDETVGVDALRRVIDAAGERRV